MTVSTGASNGGAAADDFARARTVFESALEQPPAERVRFVERTCAGDARLVAAVQAMLDADATPHPLLDRVPVLRGDRWQPGDVFGRFRIVGFLGRGGMGEVYRAHDPTLGRDVALKFLPPVYSDTNLDDRLARFQREAQVLAALNHPNIAAIHGIEDASDARALVLEFVDGPTLAAQIATGLLPLEDVVAIARQIAIGLEAAHERGIIHRDLKPGNINLRPDGTVKILDFGLAKVTQSEPVPDGVPVSTPATITSPSLTRQGVVLGTAAYASPEQAKGREADKRSDVWAFGAVVYEMLSGERAFKGADVPDTLAAVLRADIDWSRIPASTPESLRHLLSRCLDRDVTRRLRDIGEARILLDDLVRGGPSARSSHERAATTPAWRRVIPLASAALGGAALVTAILWRPQAVRPGAPLRFALSTPATQALLLDPQSRDLGLTPDGSAVVYKGGPREDQSQLFVHNFDQLEPRPLTGSGRPKSPIVSPNGQWVVFFEPGGGGGRLGAYVKKVAIGGGPTLNVSRLDGQSRGATWVSDDTIIAASAAPATGLLKIKIAGSGGEAVAVTRPNRERGERDHLWPHALPGGKTILFTITALDGGMDAAQVAALDVASGTWNTLIPGASQAQYVSSGHLVYVTGGALWAIAFDPSRVETIGTATVVVPEIVTLENGTAEFDVARDGTLVYVARGGGDLQPRTFVWVDRDGREFPVNGVPSRPYVNVRLSPDGTRVATEIADQNHDIWVWHFARETLTQVTHDPGQDAFPTWTNDGKRVIFTSQANGVIGSLFAQAADGSGAPEALTQSDFIQRANSVLSDGRLIFTQSGDLMTLGLNPDRKVETLLHSTRGVSMEGVVSRDGRWLAYTNVESGIPQIVVVALSNPSGERTQVTSNGGTTPRWAANGRELFYTSLDGMLMGVAVTTGTRFSAEVPTIILGRTYYAGRGVTSRGSTYDVAADGRFLMLKQGGDPSQLTEPPTLVVVKNWGEELRRLLPGRR